MNSKVFLLAGLFGILSGSFAYAQPPATVVRVSNMATVDETECGRIREKIDIFSNLQTSMVKDIMTVEDDSLCAPLMKQCQLFYSTALQYEKAYKDQCDVDYEKASRESCYTSDHGCSKFVARAVTPVNSQNTVYYDNMVYYSSTERKFRKVYFAK